MNLVVNYKKLGIKNTKGRSEIISILQNEETPVDVLHIKKQIKDSKLHLNEVTIYRILDTFVEKGLVQRIQFQEGKFRYELRKSDHHHLICENCGNIQDVENCDINTLEKEIFEKTRFFVKRHSLEFFGICKNCQ